MSLGVSLSLKGAEFRYPNSAKNILCGVDLEIRPGEWVAVLGSNGSGKSTTMDLLFGMGRKDSGSMRAAGFDHEKEELAMKRVVTYSSPDTSFAVWGKVGAVIRFVKDFYPAWDQELCLHLLDVFRLRPGDKILFHAEEQNGTLTLTEIH